MSFRPEFLFKITRATIPPGNEPKMMTITIRRPYAHLKEELGQAFIGQEDVKVIVDRRYVQRRTTVRPAEKERRRVDRRRTKEELVDVVIYT